MKDNTQINNVKKALPAVLLVTLFYVILALLKVGCPIKYLTGISCAGCGMTRACLAALRGNFALASYYHPLYFLIPPVLILLFFRKKMPVILFRITIFTIVAAFVIVYLCRLFNPADTIVTADFNQNIIYRLISRI